MAKCSKLSYVFIVIFCVLNYSYKQFRYLVFQKAIKKKILKLNLLLFQGSSLLILRFHSVGCVTQIYEDEI